jgi:hypothetical protein
LLTIKLRLVVASVDRALEMGIRWWEADAALTGQTQKLVAENAALNERVALLERRLAGAAP